MNLGLKYEWERDFEKVVEAYRYVVDNYPDSEYGFYCLLSLMTCRAKQDKEDLELSYLRLQEKEHRGGKIGKLATMMIPNSLVVSGDPQAAIAKCGETIQLYKDSDEQMVKQAWFEIGHIYMFAMNDRAKARQAFTELARRYPTDEILEDADLLLDSFGCERLDRKGAPQAGESLVVDYSLSQNYPNPGNPSATISFSLPQASHVSLEIYNLLGQKVRTLVEGAKEAGSHSVIWNGRDESGKVLSSGIYLYRLKTEQGDFVQVKKMLLVR